LLRFARNDKEEQRAMTQNELRKRSFDRIAELYDDARPGYPERLFDDLIRISGIPAQGRILEIGCGTGQATLPLARSGFRLLGLELGAQLAGLTSAKCRGFPKVEVRNIAFEDWPPEARAFDLVLSASAFHWIKPAIGFSRAAAALKPGGSLALAWHFRFVPDNEFHRRLRALYQRYAPDIADPKPPEERIARQQKKIASSGYFEPPVICRYPEAIEYTPEQYVKLLQTQSEHIILEEPARTKLFGAIRDLIDRLGGRVRRSSVAVLFVARRRG
jgi:SAM-dependent methyltransferase